MLDVAGWPGRRGILGVVLLGAAALVGAGVALGVLHFAGGLKPAAEAAGPRPTANVVAAVRDLARIESAQYHMERVIDLRDKQSRLFGMVRSEDAILLVAAADIVAGVDLEKMGDGSIVVDEKAKSAVVTLPAPSILSARLDPEHTFVHTRSTDLLAERDEDLESRARAAAQKELEQAAIDAGILERARHNAGETVRTLVRALGFDRVEIRWADHER